MVNLPEPHGGPVRVVVPGFIGARSVKWITTITVQIAPSDNYFQSTAYRLLPADADPETAAPGAGLSLSSIALNSDILVPDDGAVIPAGPLTIRGYAFAGDDRGVARVDVSLDDGVTWRQACLQPQRGPWAWRLWSLRCRGTTRRAAHHRACLGYHRRAAAGICCGTLESKGLRQQLVGAGHGERMRVEIIETSSLGDRSYVVIDGDTAVVIDPQRDIDRVTELLGELGVRITHVLETHLHNDYVTGGLELSRAAGAEYVVPAGDDIGYPARRVTRRRRDRRRHVHAARRSTRPVTPAST